MRVVMSGGGTAGHIYPALTVAEELRAGGRDEVTFVGTPDGPEARLVPGAGVAFVGLRAKGFDRARPLTLVTGVATVLGSTVRAVRLLRSVRADVVAGFGGYVSIPVGLAAVLTRTPLVLHEQNSVPGLANRMLSGWARAVGVTYEASSGYLKHPGRVVVTGNPVRAAVLGATRASGREALGIAGDSVVLLVFGGSRGARHINHAVVALRDELLAQPDVVVLHVAGHSEAGDVRERLAAAGGDESGRYRVFEYLEDMGSAIAAADLVIARAGATSIAEITALGRAAVLVPYPYATDDHQTLNARAVSQAGAGVLVADAELDGGEFVGMVTGLLRDGSRRATMAAASAALGRPDAGARVAALVRSAAAGEDAAPDDHTTTEESA